MEDEWLLPYWQAAHVAGVVVVETNRECLDTTCLKFRYDGWPSRICQTFSGTRWQRKLRESEEEAMVDGNI